MRQLYTLVSKIGTSFRRWSEEKKLVFLSMVCLGILFYVPNNKVLFLATFIFVSCFYILWKNIIYSLLYTYILLLPFQNGKGMEFLVVPAYLVYGNIPFTITVIYTMSNILLTMFLYVYFRKYVLKTQTRRPLSFTVTDILLCVFFVANIIASAGSDIPLLSLLLTIQVWSYIIGYFILRQQHVKQWLMGVMLPVFASLGIFEGVWSILQRVNKGLLGKTIETIDPSVVSGRVQAASEDATFFRMQGTFTHPNSLGFFMAIIAPILFYYSVSKQTSSFGKVLSAVAFMFSMGGLILSGSRASWIFCALAIFLLWSNAIVRSSLKFIPGVKRIYKLFLTVCVTLIPIIIVPRLYQLFTTFGSGGGAQFRWTLIKSSVLMTLQHPFGVGLGVFPLVFFQELGGFTSFPTQPHNLPAQILVASGVIGFVSFSLFLILVLISGFYRIHKSQHWQSLHIVYIISTGVFLSLSMFYPILTEQQIFAWLWILLAIIA